MKLLLTGYSVFYLQSSILSTSLIILGEEGLSKLELINHIFDVLVFWHISISECVWHQILNNLLETIKNSLKVVHLGL